MVDEFVTDALWDPERDRLTAFNAEHGHTPGCEFVVDDWICGEGCGQS